MDGPFAAGLEGVLKPRNGPKTSFKLTEVHDGVSFQDISFLPLARLIFTHELQREAEGCVLTHRIEIEGPLGFLFAWIIGTSLKRSLPVAMACFAELAVARTQAELTAQ